MKNWFHRYWFILPTSFFLVILPFIVPYTSLASEMLIFAIFALGYDILLGYTGLLSFGHAMFFGIGAYITAIVLKRLILSTFVSLTLSMLLAMLVALLVGALSLKRRGIYFVMLTLAFNQMFYFIAFQWRDLTGGDSGFHGVPRPKIGFIDLNEELYFYFFVCCIFIILVLFAIRIVSSPFGQVLKAIKNNEERAMSIGYNVYAFKLISFILSSLFASLAGGLYAIHLNFVPLDTLSINTSAEVVIMAILGGIGTLYGPVFGAMLLVYLKNILSNWVTYWNLIIGILFVVSVLSVRQGFLPLLKEKLQSKLIIRSKTS